MKRKLLALLFALAYTAACAATAAAFNCEVVSADGDEITLKCKAKDAKKLKAGKKVKIKVKK